MVCLSSGNDFQLSELDRNRSQINHWDSGSYSSLLLSAPAVQSFSTDTTRGEASGAGMTPQGERGRVAAGSTRTDAEGTRDVTELAASGSDLAAARRSPFLGLGGPVGSRCGPRLHRGAGRPGTAARFLPEKKPLSLHAAHVTDVRAAAILVGS
ncbi:hypothetical protein FQA47_018064 [Oryzias melastigma]|uniref:Uncharacterized protein n=1 Tax=Oryzias melastigma TaxID=30732 RepID=A0A834C1H9_ORYME|nr:hypothetical protein FQA47_018064 [Oryzias melastigma]